MRGGLAALLLLLAALLLSGCASRPPNDGWRFFDRRPDCSECVTLAKRVEGLDAEWAATVAPGHAAMADYFEQPPQPGKPIRLEWTATTQAHPVTFEFGTERMLCPMDGGNATTHAGKDWSATIRPGVGSCAADLELLSGVDAPHASVWWWLPYDGAGEAFGFTFAARRL